MQLNKETKQIHEYSFSFANDQMNSLQKVYDARTKDIQ